MAGNSDLQRVNDLLVTASDYIAEAGQKGLDVRASLVAARDSVEQLAEADRTWSSATVIALRNELTQAREISYIAPRLRSSAMVYACISLSMILMYIVGSLSIFYNNGNALLVDIENMERLDPDRLFGQLERQLLAVEDQIFPETKESLVSKAAMTDENIVTEPQSGDPSERKIDDLARESSYVTLHELRDLNSRLKSLEQRYASFMIDAAEPVYGPTALKSLLAEMFLASPAPPATAAPKPADTSSPSDAAKPHADASKSADVPALDLAKGAAYKIPPANSYFCDQQLANEKLSPVQLDSTKDQGKKPSGLQILGMNMNKLTEQACKYSLSYVSISVPSVEDWATTIKENLEPYAAWILPCLYAALGSMIFYMRLILDPDRPNPSISKIVHRLALASLAGAIVAFFWATTLGNDPDVKSAGFGLFAFAFIVGFSIDVFFAFLDRLVSISQGAISRIGA